MIEALPARPDTPLAETLKIELAIIAGYVVLAGNIEDLLLSQALQYLIERVKLAGSGQVGKIARVDDEVRLLLEPVDLLDGDLKGSGNIGIGWFVEADVAI